MAAVTICASYLTNFRMTKPIKKLKEDRKNLMLDE